MIRDVLAEVQREPNSEKVKSELSEIEQLARLVRQGDQEKAALLLQSVEQLIRQQEYLAPQALKLLLDSGIPDARKRYLARIAHAKQGAVNSFSHERFLDSTLTLLLHQLFPAYRPLYFEQVIALLESESLIEREAGVNSLTYTLRCDFSFDPASLRAERLRKLAIMEPMFDRLKDASETQTHALVLEHLGIVLEGPPGDGWLPRLSAAVFDRDPNVAGTALRLIEILCEAPQLRRLENLPPAHRGRAIKAFLIDAERIRA